MPYMIVEDGNKWIVKKKVNGKPSGKGYGRHRSKSAARKQMGSLCAEEDKKKKELMQSLDIEPPPFEEDDSVEESYDDEYSYAPTYNAKDFKQLKMAEEASEISEKIAKRGKQMQEMVSNITWSFIYAEDKSVSGLRSELGNLFDSFMDEVESIMGIASPEEVTESSLTESKIETTFGLSNVEEYSKETFTESIKDALFGFLSEDEEKVVEGIISDVNSGKIEANRAPLFLDLKVIESGWGNKRDNHYYSKDMLEEYAPAAFTGAKMYATDHNQSEKSVKTWVSTAIRHVGFTETGAPVQRVFVHNGEFAESLRNLNKGGIVERMAGSICASGTVDKEEFEKNGRKGRKVIELFPGAGIDWVTEAGAGGKVIGLIESSFKEGKEGGTSMPENEENKGILEETETEVVAINESEPEETPESDPVEETLSKDRKSEIFSESKLPAEAIMKLWDEKYLSEKELEDAIAKEKKYLEKCTTVTGDVSTGRIIVTDMGEDEPAPEESTKKEALITAEEAEKKLNEICPLY